MSPKRKEETSMENPSRKDLESLVLAFLAEPVQADFIVAHRGEVFTIQPLTLPAQRYADQNLPRNPELWSGSAFSIPASRFVDVVSGIQESGLTLEGGAN